MARGVQLPRKRRPTWPPPEGYRLTGKARQAPKRWWWFSRRMLIAVLALAIPASAQDVQADGLQRLTYDLAPDAPRQIRGKQAFPYITYTHTRPPRLALGRAGDVFDINVPAWTQNYYTVAVANLATRPVSAPSD